MKTSVKSVVGVIVSLTWFVAYVGGGAFLLAWQATTNPYHVAVYVPLVIFLWIVGFFVGHTAIEKFLLIFFKSGKSSAASVQNTETVEDIDIIRPIYSSKIATNLLQVETIYPSRIPKSNNNKKETNKIIRILKKSGKIYKVPLYSS